MLNSRTHIVLYSVESAVFCMEMVVSINSALNLMCVLLKLCAFSLNLHMLNC